MQYKKLSECAEVQSGLVLSRKEAKTDFDLSIEYKNLNLRSINDDGSINVESLDLYLASEKLEDQFITSAKDIVIRLFPPFCPVLITESLSGLVVPSQFTTIRIRNDEILPEFLCCYLSHRRILESLAIRESGQVSGGIKISALSELNIPLPSAIKQKAVAEYSQMNLKQKQLHLELIQQYDLKMDAVINSVIGGE